MVTVGASEISVMLGIQRRMGDGDPYCSELELQARLLGKVPRYSSDPADVDAIIGRHCEAAVASAAMEVLGLRPVLDVLPGPQLDQPGLVHPDFPWLHARTDLVILPGKLVPRHAPLELKAPRDLDPERWGPEGNAWAGLPADYLVQLMVQLAVFHAHYGSDEACLVAMARAPRRAKDWLRVYWLERDPSLEHTMLGQAGAWYARHVVEELPVPPDGSASSSSVLDQLWTPREDKTLYAGPDLASLAQRLQQRKTALGEIERGVEQLEQEIKAAMGEHTVLKHRDKVLATWRLGRSGRRYFRLKQENK